MKKLILFIAFSCSWIMLQAQNKEKSFSEITTLTPTNTIGGTSYPSASLNFMPPSFLKVAGDINKDGFQDFYHSVIAADATTSDLADQVLKTTLFFGSSNGISKENVRLFDDATSIFKRDLKLIGDLTGDGIPEGFTYSDSTLKIYTDASGGNLTQVGSKDLISGLSVFTSRLEVKNYGDFNRDGYNDLIVYSNDVSSPPTSHIYLIYGSSSLSGLIVNKIPNNAHTASSGNGNWDQQFLYSDIDDDGVQEIVHIIAGTQYSDGRVFIYRLDSNDELSNVTDFTFPYGSFDMDFHGQNSPQVVDINKDGFKELVIYVNDRTIIFTEDTVRADAIYDVFDRNEFLGNGFSIIGDYNGDTFVDILIEGETPSIVFGNSELDLNTITPNFGAGKFSTITNTKNDSSLVGDVNGDGLDDLILEFSMENSYGYRTFFGNASGDFTNTSEISYPTPYLPYEFSYYTLNAGDLNNDGVEDYGIVYKGSASATNAYSRLEIFFGGDLSKSTPDLIINHPDKYDISMPASGDFNGDGYSDIAVNYLNKTSGINIYLGGGSMDNDSDYELTFSQMFPDQLDGEWSNSTFSALSNAGDMNNDGIDDLVFSSFQAKGKTYLLFGGDSFSTAPDLEIDFFATNIVSLKDFNGDGINDIALASIYLGNPYGNTVLLFPGFDSKTNEIFSGENIIKINEPISDGTRVLTNFGITMDGGDFNGDGFTDLAVSSQSHFLIPSSGVASEGVESIYIYLGSATPDSITDYKFGLKTNLFAGYKNTIQTSQLLTNHIGELTTVPDQNGDGTDEILIGTTPQFVKDPALVNENVKTNAVLYYGATDITQINDDGDILFKAPNPYYGLGTENNSFPSQTAHSAVGDFNGDGETDYMFTQGNDFNFVKSPVYVYNSDQTTVGIDNELTQVRDFKLHQNYPNPFNPTTNINYSVPKRTEVSLKVYDVTGRLVATIVDNKVHSVGNYSITLNASAWASGVYFYRLEAGDFIKSQKLTLIK
ncbi:MAG: T9SS type A sorting domain-containing protein [Balneola sp.]